MNTMLGTPPRGTQSSAAAFFASPSSPVPRRPVATPTSLASSNLRGASSPLSQRRTQHHHHHQQQPHLHFSTNSTTPPRSSQSSLDRYVCPSLRHDNSMAHFLLTSAEHKTPMLIRAAQQRHLSVRSPSRDTASMPSGSLRDVGYPSPTRYAVDHSSPNRGVASPRPHGSLPRAGSTRLSEVFAKMHLDPSVRGSRDRSVSNASMMGDASAMGANGTVDGDAGSPLNFSFPASTMEPEPYTTKLARTLFSDVEQTTVLSVNDTAMRPTAPPSAPPPPPPPSSFPSVFGNGSLADPSPSVTLPSFDSSLQTPITPRSPEVTDPAAIVMDFESTLASLRSRDGENGGVRRHNENSADEDDEEGDDRDSSEEEEENAFHHRCYMNANDEAEEDQTWEGGSRGAENSRGRRTAMAAAAAAARSGFSRVPLATSDVNLYGMSEAERYDASLGVVFECNRTRNFTSPSFRVIPHTPERILDAADMEDDFYMNLIDWSSTSDVLCVALQSCVYLWDAKTCGITELPRVATSASADTRSASAHLVCGLNWAPDGRHLAVGRNCGTVEVWDVEAQRVVHTYQQHADRVVSLSWEPQGGSLLASGSRDSNVVLRDVREWVPASPTSAFASTPATTVLRGHETEVCGLKWSPDGAMLASGGNDNQLLLWDRRSIHGSSSSSSGSPLLPSSSAQPLFYLNKHTAAVKALSWNPQQPALLASGGGSHDKSLRFWNTLTGECVHHINTGSQVCGVVWNRAGTELVTAHGYTDNQLSIWRYPSLRRIANLIGHTSRVLHLALSADGETVVSAAGDETLRFWRCFSASELRESSPHLYRSFYSPSSASSLTRSPYLASAGAGGGSAVRARAAAIAAGRCGSASPDRDSLAFMSEEVELR